MQLFVIRHSERLDDVAEPAWKKLVTKNSAANGRKSFSNDPIISPTNGIQYAVEMSQTVKNIVERSGSIQVRLFASRLLRAVQTASYIARELDVPLHVSSGLAQIIPVVKNSKGSFQFASLHELYSYCPAGVRLVDCDVCQSPIPLPVDGWRSTLNRIITSSQGMEVLNIIVAHRETVRKLAGEYMQTPYCCLGIFEVVVETASSLDSVIPSYDGKISAVAGSDISSDSFSLKEPTVTVVDEVHAIRCEENLGHHKIGSTSSGGNIANSKGTITVKDEPKRRSINLKPKNAKNTPAVRKEQKDENTGIRIEFVSILDRDGTVVAQNN